jgi:hypothetical protein
MSTREDSIARLKALKELVDEMDGALETLQQPFDDANDLDVFKHKIIGLSMGHIPKDYIGIFNDISEPFFYMDAPEGALWRRIARRFVMQRMFPFAIEKISRRAKEDLREGVSVEVAGEDEWTS